MSNKSVETVIETYKSPVRRYSVLELAREVQKAYKATAAAASKFHMKLRAGSRETLREEVAHFLPQSSYNPLLFVSGRIKKDKFGKPVKASIRLTVDDSIPASVVSESAVAPLKDKRFQQSLSNADKRTAKKATRIK